MPNSYEIINELANEYYENPSPDKKSKIIALLFNLGVAKDPSDKNQYDPTNNNHFVPLITKWVPYDVFVKVCFGVLGDEITDCKVVIGKRLDPLKEKKVTKYDPNKEATFISHFRNQLNFALMDYSEKEASNKIDSLDRNISSEDDSSELKIIDILVDDSPTPEESLLIKYREIIDFGVMLEKFEATLQEKSKTRIRENYFRAIFSYDVIHVVKTDEENGKTAAQEPQNTCLFRKLITEMISFLIVEPCDNMKKIVDGSVQSYVKWGQRQTMVEQCYNKTGLNAHFQAYQELKSKIFREIEQGISSK